MKLKMLPALAFVPEEDVVDAFHILPDKIDFPVETLEILDYFERTWIGRGSKRNPLFPPEAWNCSYAVKNK